MNYSYNQGHDAGYSEGHDAGFSEGHDAGEASGISKGKDQGMDLLSLLIRKLMDNKRDSEISKVVSSIEYRDKLLKEFGIE